MGEANFLFYNGKISKTGKALIFPDNRSFLYGDGFFETIKYVNGSIELEDLHFERLFASLERMQFQKPVYFTQEYLRKNIEILAKKNYHHKLGRIRITIFRGDGGLYDVSNHFPHHLIQSWELNPSNQLFNENGLVLDFYRDARKTSDFFSSLKSNNYLPYTMGALWAKSHQLNDAILLNPYDRIAEATIANIFLVKDGVVKTPALTEGPVDGVMRKYLLACLRKENIPVEETGISVEEIMQASEVFLTNSIYGIRWVKSLGVSNYTNQFSSLFFKMFLPPAHHLSDRKL
ncbi:MAG: hypothetical protein RLZZ28_1045 [Bacteroidota bacterium]|jgi:branched-chain amino acid aminotransferase